MSDLPSDCIASCIRYFESCAGKLPCASRRVTARGARRTWRERAEDRRRHNTGGRIELAADQVAEARRMRSEDLASWHVIAAFLGVSHPTAKRVVCGYQTSVRKAGNTQRIIGRKSVALARMRGELPK